MRLRARRDVHGPERLRDRPVGAWRRPPDRGPDRPARQRGRAQRHVRGGRQGVESPVVGRGARQSPAMTQFSERSVAFVLGGGGVLGANEVGMLRALLEAGIVPDVILGTSIGAVNGAVLASDPTTASVERLTELWTSADEAGIFSGGMLSRLGTL